jgi:hypothetical protein
MQCARARVCVFVCVCLCACVFARARVCVCVHAHHIQSRDDLLEIFPPESLGALIEKNFKIAVATLCMMCDHASFPLYLKQVKRLLVQLDALNLSVVGIRLKVTANATITVPHSPAAAPHPYVFTCDRNNLHAHPTAAAALRLR